MRSLLILLSIICLAGCEVSESRRGSNPDTTSISIHIKGDPSTTESSYPPELWIQEIGGCEYVIYRTYAQLSGYTGGSTVGVAMVHKQNCKYCEARNKHD